MSVSLTDAATGPTLTQLEQEYDAKPGVFVVAARVTLGPPT